MHFKTTIFSIAIVLLSKTSICQTYSSETIQISTTYGNIQIKLFNETPLHKANFLKLVREHFYDSLLFHRVISGFMIQGGDPDSKLADSKKLLGDGDLKYTIPAEFVPALFHKKGMLCAARNGDDINPTKASSACQFYIVQGKVRNDKELKDYERRVNKEVVNKLKETYFKDSNNIWLQEKISHFKSNPNADSLLLYSRILDEKIDILLDQTPHYKFPNEHKAIYKSLGGTPQLDNNYTIFGEVILGLEIIDKIAGTKTNKDDRPIVDIRMTMSIIE